jgi:pimeloyl-ACP methyl ester carboxylesterase
MGDNAVTIYDDLAARLKKSPMAFDFPLPSAGFAQREFTFTDLETAASSSLYAEAARMIFLRALAAYARNDDLAPMARILYDSLSLDPETLAAVPDPSYSDAVYYAVECRDYAYFSGTVEERALAYMRSGDELDASLPRFASVFYGDLPCVFWPNARSDPAHQAPLKTEGIPTLVLNATTDPATPYSNAQAVHAQLAQSYLVTETGGPHVIFGWGNICVDDLVTVFLVEDQLPPLTETVCEGNVAAEFVTLAPPDAAEFENPLEALFSVDNEIYYLPEYYYWDMETPTSVGCPFGGMLTYQPSDVGEAFTLTDCAFSADFVMSGEGSYNYDQELFTLNVTVNGLTSGTLAYSRDGEGARHVTGMYVGQAVDLSAQE